VEEKKHQQLFVEKWQKQGLHGRFFSTWLNANYQLLLAQAMSILIRDGGKRKTFGKRGRLRIVARFSLDREVQEWIALYKKLAA